ncbi:GNAT family N-acetyltransferase [Reichenbachiella versicolor]|uniref:GNAT family N-acetyltransferase n=1 Tax=Reichenbachiella versicolor TaxID=1821036 RepID=UPI000D6DE7FF|nr:GNAT family N-acetyltransferase [Reichenbachiella versicolor]
MIEFKKVGSLSDFGTVEDLAKKIWTEHYVPIIGQDQVSYMLDHIQSFKAIRHQVREGAKYYIILSDYRPVGYLSYEVREDDAFISKIYVDASQRGKGIGKKAIEFTEKESKKSSLKALSLSVNKHNEVAREFYKKNGFKIIEDVVVDIGGGFVMDDYIMRKSISV